MSIASIKRSAFFVSDRTGKTAESIGHSLLSQFDAIEFECKTYAFVNTGAEARRVAGKIQQDALATGQQPLVFSTLVDAGIQKLFASIDACVISLFDTFISPLEKSLQMSSSHSMGMPHEEYSDHKYRHQIAAIEFALGHDDGMKADQLGVADVVVIGISRSAKTPTCIYLAVNFSIKAANYPLTDDDFDSDGLPGFLLPCKEKVVGLTITPEQLARVRQIRRFNSHYASLKKCRQEVKKARSVMQKAGIFILDTTSMSIEEIAVSIVKEKKLLKRV